MDAVKFTKEKFRMCKSNEDCRSCELYDFKIKADMDCGTYIDEYPEEAVAIVEKWSKEHPRKTMLQDFLEKYPDAPLLDGLPEEVCPHQLGFEYIKTCASTPCKECWSRQLEE